MSFNFEQLNGIGVLKLYGDHTFRNAANVKKAFFVALSNSEHLIVDFKDVSKIDDFFMDQVSSLRNISRKSKKKLTIINFHPALIEKKEDQAGQQERYQEMMLSWPEL
jgi:anti-anti-sigma regulatory factor